MTNLKNKLLAMGFASAIATSGVLIAKHEGLVLGTYVDPIGILTSCFGHTGKELRLGQKFSEEECLAQLAEDLLEHEKQMTDKIKVRISNEERAAYLSFVYNVGIGNFSKSTLLKKLNSGDRYGACSELLKWNRAGGKVLNGLVKRRQSEKELCLQGVNK